MTGQKHRLESLRDVKRVMQNYILSDRQLSMMPTFGGEEPEDTSEVWSWDEYNLLIGCGVDDLKIVPR
jgi:hypothetical protein